MSIQMFRSRIVTIGSVSIGGMLPVKVQSMTNTPTMDTEATAAQVERLVHAGCELVRITARNTAEARNLENIKQAIKRRGIAVPLIADIHFNPEAALVAATIVDKVRINPGNYVDRPPAGQKSKAYSDSEYQDELQRIAERLSPLIDICKAEGTAIRVGTNHGSLSQRILDRFGNTPEGMVESAMEFVRILNSLSFEKLVLSMKSSDIHVMLRSYRLLVERMQSEHFDYPLHLGVTEAGAGEDGIVKSACGIGPLLAEGLGDTIRVSLTGAPESEIPAALQLVNQYRNNKEFPLIPLDANTHQPNDKISIITALPIVKHAADVTYIDHPREVNSQSVGGMLMPYSAWTSGNDRHYPLFESVTDLLNAPERSTVMNVVKIDSEEKEAALLSAISDPLMLLLDADDVDIRSLYSNLKNILPQCKIALKVNASSAESLDATVKWSAVASEYLSCGGISALWLCGGGDDEFAHLTAQSVLQSHGLRRSKAEFVSCPSCGRTEFDIEAVLEQVKAVTSQLTHLKIAVMGCIVNGPGEMAGADYGCVGMGKNEVALYKAGVMVQSHIPQGEVADKLCELIRQHGDWDVAEA